MKKIILLTFFILSNFLYSQRYEVKYTLDIVKRNKNYGDGCKNNIKVIIFYKINGVTKSKKIFDQDLNGGGGVYNKTMIIEGNDLFFTKVKTITSRNWKRFFGGCGGDGSFDDSSRTTNINSGCSKYLSGDGLARWWITSLNIKITPQINLTSNQKEVCEKAPVKINSNFHGNRKNFYEWEFLDPVNLSKRPTRTYSHYLGYLGQRKRYEKYKHGALSFLYIYGSLLNNIMYLRHMRGLFPPQVRDDRLKHIRNLYNIKRKLSSKKPAILKEAIQILNKSNTFIDEVMEKIVFKTEERKYMLAWRPIGNKDGQSIIYLKLSDLYANEADRKKVLKGKKINIRLNPSCNGDKDISNVVSIQFLPEPPGVAKAPEFNSPKCFYDKIPNFKFFFKRNLYDGEELYILLKRKLNSFPYTYVPYDKRLDIKLVSEPDGTFSYTWDNPQKGLEGGKYKAIISGFDTEDKSIDSSPFCKEESYDFEITVPKPVTFETKVEQQETCFGAKDGKIKITATGGTGSYYYSVDNGSTWSSTTFSREIVLNGKEPKAYNILVKDSNKCGGRSKSKQVSIEKKEKITHKAVVFKEPSAPKVKDASIKISNLKGGTKITNYYNYKILKNGSNPNHPLQVGRAYKNFIITGLPAGHHTIIYTDKNNCTQEYNLPTIRDPNPITFNVTATKPNCFGRKGVISIFNITGGYPGYKVIVTRSDGLVKKTRTNITRKTTVNVPSGNYKITVKDSRLIAQTSKNIKVQEQDKLRITKITSSPISCYGGTSKVTVTAVGGKSKQYQYALYKNSNLKWQKSNIFYLKASNVKYRFMVRDKLVSPECTSDVKIMDTPIIQPKRLEVINKFVTHNAIFGGFKGEIKLNIEGGTPNASNQYTITWTKKGDTSFSKTGNPLKGLAAGFYTAEVRDVKGCIVNSTNFPILKDIEVKENPKLTAVLKISKRIKCFEGLGSLRVESKGGSGNYTYNWYKNDVLQTKENSNEFLNTGYGKYKVIISDGFKTVTVQGVLNQPKGISFSTSKKDISCFGELNGKIKLAIRGGSGNYLYSIDNRNTYKKVSDLNNYTITGLGKGEFSVWIKDDQGCEVKQSQNVTIIEPLAIKIISSRITNCETTKGQEGSIKIVVSGGKEPYTFLWTKENTPTFSRATKDIATLSAGRYAVLIKDANNCTRQKKFEVKEPLPIDVKIKKIEEILCNGEATGGLIAKVTGGYPINSKVSDFTYKWYSLQGEASTLINETSDRVRGLKAGFYKVEVRDVRGETAVFKYNLSQPDKIKIQLVSKQDVQCFGSKDGKIDVNITGGSSNYTYSWAKVGDYSFIKNTQNIDSLEKGSYVLTVTDTNICDVESTVFKIAEPKLPLEVDSFSISNLKGYQSRDGSISVTPKGGVPAYSYSWNKTDNPKIISTNNKIENIEAGSYDVIIKDSNNCSTKKRYYVTQPDPLKIVSIKQKGNILCYGDKGVMLLVKLVIGGVKPYRYNWYVKGSSKPISTKKELHNIGAGEYLIEIIDKNGIKTQKKYKVLQPLILEIDKENKKDITCKGKNNGSIVVEAKGGVKPYSYSWSNGLIGNKIKNLTAGDYFVTIRDKNLCEINKKITINEPSPISVKLKEIKNVTGYDLSNGSIKVKIEGGTFPYRYQWKDSSGVIISETTDFLRNKKAGNYTLTVTDKNLCKLTLVYEIKEPLPLKISVANTSVFCKGGKGNLKANVEGGVFPYTYKWYSPEGFLLGEENQLIIKSGVYTLTVTDKNSNTQELKNIELKEPSQLEIGSELKEDVFCYGGNNGRIMVEARGGVPPYIYSWSHGVTGNNIEELPAGSYTLTIRDKNLCEITKEFVISEPNKYSIIETELIRPSTDGSYDGSIQIKVIGGKPPYNFKWKKKGGKQIFDENTPLKINNLQRLAEGTYSVLVTDSRGCMIEETYNLANPGELLVSITQTQEILCHGGSNAVLDVVTVGGSGGNNYRWYSIKDNKKVLSTKKQLVNIPVGDYYVVVDNAEGIKERSSIFRVKQPTKIKVKTTVNDVSCFQGNDGYIKMELSGGSNEYYYRYKGQSKIFSHWERISQNNFYITKLEKDSYIIQIRDSNGCFATNEEEDNVFNYQINQPEAIKFINKRVVNPTGYGLSNGFIEVEIDGGTLPYSLEWEKESKKIGKTTTSRVLSSRIKNVTSGNYKIKVIDSKGCRAEREFVLKEPLPLKVTIERISVVSCKGSKTGKLKVNAMGGVGNYSYSWYKDKTTKKILSSAQELSNVGAAIYYVEVEDSKGNKIRSKNYNLTEPEELTVSLKTDFTLCGTGKDWIIKSDVKGGTRPYNYLWSTGSTADYLSDVELGKYTLTVVDVNGCKREVSVRLVPPSPIKISSEKITNPICFDGNDGSIKLIVTGGIPPYNYNWGNIEGTDVVTGLKEGKYFVEITDSKGCSISKKYSLKNPEKIEIALKKDIITICKNQTYLVDASIDSGVKYEWTSKNGFYSTNPLVELSRSGIYNVKVITKLGCSLFRKIEIKESANEINSDFIMSSQVYTNESFVIVNISGSANHRVTWLLPDGVKVLKKNENYCELLIEKEGDFEISLVTEVGDCQEFKTKKVLVINKNLKTKEESSNINKQLINFITLYPNPSSGQFKIDVELTEKSPINIKFYNLKGIVLKEIKYYDKKIYNLEYNFNLTSGVYFVLIETKNERIMKKIIIR